MIEVNESHKKLCNYSNLRSTYCKNIYFNENLTKLFYFKKEQKTSPLYLRVILLLRQNISINREAPLFK